MSRIEPLDELVSHLPCANDGHYPFKVHVNSTDGSTFIGLTVRTGSGILDGGGGRTDIHDVFSTLMAVCLRSYGLASSAMIHEVGWAGQPEIYMRFLDFQQPFAGGIPNKQAGRIVQLVRAHVAFASHEIGKLINSLDFSERPPTWSDEVSSSLRSAVKTFDSSEEGIEITRQNPFWQYITTSNNQIAITVFETEYLPELLKFWVPEEVERPKRLIVVENDIYHSLDSERLHAAIDAVNKIEAALPPMHSGATRGFQTTIPLETHFVVCGTQTMAVVESRSGLRSFQQAQEQWREGHETENRLLSVNSDFEWNHKIDPNRLEDLVFSILEDQADVAWVRQSGATNDRDRGRDIAANMFTAAGMAISQSYGSSDNNDLSRLRKIVVQVKSRKKSVGTSDVTNIRDTIEDHEADGYLLVAYPIWSAPLFDRLEKLAKGYWVDVWGKAQLESKLRMRLHLLPRFKDVVQKR